MLVEFLIDEDGYELNFEVYQYFLRMTIKDPVNDLRNISFDIKEEDVDFIIEKLKCLKNG